MSTVTLRLEVEGKAGQMRLMAVAVEWSINDLNKRASPTGLKNNKAANALLEVCARYKLWCLTGGYRTGEPFMIRQGKGSFVETLHNLLTGNAHSPSHWMSEAFGTTRVHVKSSSRERTICRAAELFQVPKINNEYKVTVSELLHPDNIHIRLNNELLDQNGLKTLIDVLGAKEIIPQTPITTIRVDEGIKLLDLREWWPIEMAEEAPINEGRVILTDHYAFSQIENLKSHLTFYYATQGTGLHAKSLSHSDCHMFDLTNAHHSVEDKHLAKQAELRIGLDATSPDTMQIIMNEIEYVGAFKNETEEWFHTHVLYHAQQLTFILMFPKTKPCKEAWGLFKNGHVAVPNRYERQQPIRNRDGQLVYWRVLDVKPGETYEIRWKW